MQRRVLAAVAVAAVVAAAVVTSVVRGGPAVSGDGIRTFEPSKLALDDDTNISSPAAAGGVTALAGNGGSPAVVVGAGDAATSHGVPLTPVMVRADGSGVSIAGMGDAVRVTGFDAEGRETFSLNGATGLTRLAERAGDPLPQGEVRAAVDTVTSRNVVVEACVNGEDSDTSALFGLDAVTGDVRWRRTDRVKGCALRDAPWGNRSLVQRRLIGPETLVLDAATGDVVRQLDDATTRVTVIDDVIYTQSDDGSLTRLDDAGQPAWTVDGCRGDTVSSSPLDGSGLRSSGPFLVLSCSRTQVALDPETGASRVLPGGARGGEEKFVDEPYNADVAPPYLNEDPGTDIDRPVTPVIGTVLVTRKGRAVTATDALTGKRLWTREAQADDDDRLTVQAFVPDDASTPGAVAIRSVSYEQSDTSSSWKGSAQVTVLDARSGREIARTRRGGAWTADGTPAGGILLVHVGDDPVVALLDPRTGD